MELGLVCAEPSPVTTDVSRLDRTTWQVVSSRTAMGTLVAITAIGRSEHTLEYAIGTAFEEMDRLIDLFNRYDSSSPLSQLNQAGHLDAPPPELAHVVGCALGYHRLSSGAFDISVAPIVDLFVKRFGGAVPAPPSAAEISEVLDLVGARHVAASRRRITLAREGMALTLDGIAKGYIVDAIAKALERCGVRQFLINAGGDIRAKGRKTGARPWTVAVQDPWERGEWPDTIHLRDAAVATSGNYEVSFDDDRLFHHIVNARTGRSPRVAASVSVVAPTAVVADALATAVFVMGPEAGVAFVDGQRGCACLVIDRDGTQLKSRHWSSAPHPADGGTQAS